MFSHFSVSTMTLPDYVGGELMSTKVYHLFLI